VANTDIAAPYSVTTDSLGTGCSFPPTFTRFGYTVDMVSDVPIPERYFIRKLAGHMSRSWKFVDSWSAIR